MSKIHLAELTKHFEAYIERSPRKFRRIQRKDMEWFRDPASASSSSDDLTSYQLLMGEESGVAIHIPDYKMDDFLSCITDHKLKELEVRNSVPAVKKAYEQYKLLLKMCGVDDAGY